MATENQIDKNIWIDITHTKLPRQNWLRNSFRERVGTTYNRTIFLLGGVNDMANELKIKLYSFTLDCIDPHELAKFYAALLGWEVVFFDKEYACVGAPGTQQGAYPGITFQRNPQYQPPVWPDAPEA